MAKKIKFYAEVGKHNHRSVVFAYDDDVTDDEIQSDFNAWVLGIVGGGWYEADENEEVDD